MIGTKSSPLCAHCVFNKKYKSSKTPRRLDLDFTNLSDDGSEFEQSAEFELPNYIQGTFTLLKESPAPALPEKMQLIPSSQLILSSGEQDVTALSTKFDDDFLNQELDRLI